jgi:hypothetical protein
LPASFCDAKGEKHLAPQHSCCVSPTFPRVRFLTGLCPVTGQQLLRRQNPRLGQAVLNCCFPENMEHRNIY